MVTKLVTFDAFQTLFRPRDSIANLYIAQLKRHCRDAPVPEEAAVSNSFKTTFKQMNAQYPLFGRNLKGGHHAWWERVVNGTFTGAGVNSKHLTRLDTHNRTLATTIIHHFSTPTPYKLNPSALSTFSFLRNKYPDILIGVISNSDPRTESILHQFGLDPDFVVTSYAAGVEKPNPLIFEMALKTARELKGVRIELGQALHVGDDCVKDWEAARLCGWNAGLLKEWGELRETVEQEIHRF
ncbi:hypothetical protein HDU98_010780 [Podochytrium sp. JEL0797]|nr:hypothetical protein HDU98_010780 [Podochytrium sp. JEL0797]